MADLISGLSPGFYTLTVTDDRGCEAVWTFEVKFISGITEVEGTAVLLIYPNPAGETATMSGDFQGRPAPARLDLYDAAGQPTRSLALPGNGGDFVWQISLEGLATGQYLAYLKDKNGSLLGSGKLIKH